MAGTLAPLTEHGGIGALHSSDYGSEQVLWPEEKLKALKDPERILPRIEPGHDDDNQKREWVEAIRAGKPEIALSNFDYAATLTESLRTPDARRRTRQLVGSPGRPTSALFD